MRQVFSSPRLENVERMAEIMREAGIEVQVTGGRSYKGGRRRQFSYREAPRGDETAAVWVVRADDLPKARQILREAGLLASTVDEQGRYVGLAGGFRPPEPEKRGNLGLRLRIIVVLIAAAVSALLWSRLG